MTDRHVVYDEGDGTYLTRAFDGDGVTATELDLELWDLDVRKAKHFDTYAEAIDAIEKCDEDELLRDRLIVIASNLLDEDLAD